MMTNLIVRMATLTRMRKKKKKNTLKIFMATKVTAHKLLKNS